MQNSKLLHRMPPKHKAVHNNGQAQAESAHCNADDDRVHPSLGGQGESLHCTAWCSRKHIGIDAIRQQVAYRMDGTLASQSSE